MTEEYGWHVNEVIADDDSPVYNVVSPDFDVEIQAINKVSACIIADILNKHSA